MVQFPRHAVIEFDREWSIKSWHCVACTFQSETKDQLVEHVGCHVIKSSVITLTNDGMYEDGKPINHEAKFDLGDETEFAIKIEPVDIADFEQPIQNDIETKEEDNKEDILGEISAQENTIIVKQEPVDDQDGESPILPTFYVCSQCHLPFTTESALNNHVKTMHIGTKGVCNICGKFYAKLSDLDRHTLEEHSKIRIKKKRSLESTPPLTTKVLKRGPHTKPGPSNLFDLMEYIDDPGSDRKYKCRQCGNAFKMRHHLFDHIKAIHQQLSYACEVCHKQYKSKRTLKMHLLDHQDQGVATNVESYHRCQICKKAFLRRHQFENHVRVRHGTVMYPCHLCEKRFTHEELLHAHMRCHKETNKYKCQICNTCFATVKERQLHTEVHTEDIKVELADSTNNERLVSLPGVPVICSICGLTFANDEALKVHCIKEHNDPVVISCNLCSSEFASFLDLLNHIKEIHKASIDSVTSDKAVTVTQEVEEFQKNVFLISDINGLKEKEDEVEESSDNPHETGKRPKKFKCQDCGKRFGYSHHLKDHANSFHKGMLYTCGSCGKQYKRRYTLKYHTCTAASCQLCSKPFQYRGHLKKHLKEVHGIEDTDEEDVEDTQESFEDGNEIEDWKIVVMEDGLVTEETEMTE